MRSSSEVSGVGAESVHRRLEPLELGLELADVARPDVGLQHERDARAVLADGLGGAAHDVEDLVPVALMSNGSESL